MKTSVGTEMHMTSLVLQNPLTISHSPLTTSPGGGRGHHHSITFISARWEVGLAAANSTSPKGGGTLIPEGSLPRRHLCSLAWLGGAWVVGVGRCAWGGWEV